jgi:hypothetical protein
LLVFGPFGLKADDPVDETFIKPHGRRLTDGRVLCWGRATDWKIILMAAFERSFASRGVTTFAVVLIESAGKYSDTTARAVFIEAAKLLKIERVVWDS